MKEQDYKEMAIKLWQLLDDIDTLSDVAKGDNQSFREVAEKIHKKRFDIMTSDGYDLFVGDHKVTNVREEPSDDIPQADIDNSGC